jgi:hypothetical protein
MLKNIREILEGAGIGLLGGLIIGISDHDWMRLTLALGLIAYTGGVRRNLTNPEINHRRYTFTGFAAFLAVLAGLYLNRQQVFDQSPVEAVNALIEAGYDPAEARLYYVRQVLTEKAGQETAAPSFQDIIGTFTGPVRSDSLEVEPDTIIGR